MDTKTAVEETTQSVTPEELIQVIQQLASRTLAVDPVADVSSDMRRKLVKLDPEMVNASLSAMHTSPEVQAALGRNDADVTAESSAAMTWSVAIDVVRQYVNGLAEANTRRLERVGLTALQTYGICRQLARDHRHTPALTPHLEDMKRIMGRRRRKQHSAPAPQQSA